MKNIRSVGKHFGPDTSVTQGHNKLYLKSPGESWVELHSSNNLIDILSLPSFLRMGRLETVRQKDNNY